MAVEGTPKEAELRPDTEEWEECEECGGTGECEFQRGGGGDIVEDVMGVCSECGGTGRVPRRTTNERLLPHREG